MTLDAWLNDRPELTEAAFGQQIGVSQAAVNRYRKGLRYPEPPVMRRIMRVTDRAVTPEDFLMAQPADGAAA